MSRCDSEVEEGRVQSDDEEGRVQSDDEEGRVQSDNEACSNDGDGRDLTDGREDEAQNDEVDAGLQDFCGYVDENDNFQGGYGGRGNNRGSNKRGNRKNRGRGKRGRVNFNNASFSNSNDNFNAENCENGSDGENGKKCKGSPVKNWIKSAFQNNKGNNNNQNNNNNKGGGGDVKWDVLSRHLKHLCYSMGLLKRTNGPGYTLESLCLQFHYRFLVLFFCISYFIVALNWYVNERIICYKLGASQSPQTGPHRDVCLSYPFVETAAGMRRYLLFYRYVPYSFLLMAAAMYTLRAGPIKKWENSRLGQLYKDVWNERSRYETSHWTTANRRVVHFIMTRQAESCHYYKWILCHVFANLVVMAAVFYFDFVLQGSFVTLVPDVMHSLHRDPMYFRDPLSTIFPPFAECQITQFHKILFENELNFGCHLTLMELYEKLFFVTWCVLAAHWIWSSVMILWLTVGLVPFFGKLSCVATSHVKYRESAIVMWKTVRMCSLGEVHVLYLVKRWMSCAQFSQLLATLLCEKEREKALLKQERKSGSSFNCANHIGCTNHIALPIEHNDPSADKNAPEGSEQFMTISRPM